MKFAQPFATLFLLAFAALSTVGGGCFDWAVASATRATPDCCAGNDIHFTCQVQVRTVEMAKADGLGVNTTCFTGYPTCASSLANAEEQAQSQAILNYMNQMKNTTVQGVKCWPLAQCIQMTRPQDFKELDYPGTCNAIAEVDAGSPPACVAVSGACGDCLNTCCAQVSECNGDPSCNEVLAYWTQAGKAHSNLDALATALDDCISAACEGICPHCKGNNEGCVDNGDCCSDLCPLNACGGDAP